MKTKPFRHQAKEFAESKDAPARGLLWGMRTGKSKVCVDTGCHLFANEFAIDSALVFAPNGVHENWAVRELPAHGWDGVPIIPFVWRTDRKNDPEFLAEFKRALQTRTAMPWFCFASATVTRDDVRKFVYAIVKHRQPLFIGDEAHDYRTPGSKRSHMARAVAKKCPYRRILTGTPTENSGLHAWGAFELLEKGALGYERYTDFEAEYGIFETRRRKGGGKYQHFTGIRGMEKLRDSMARLSSVVLRENCDDMPELVPRERRLAMTPQQQEIYAKLQSDAKDIGYDIKFQKRTWIKLQQVLSGFIYDDAGLLHEIPGGCPKMNAVLEEVYLAPSKVIIWCAFQEDVRRVAAAIRAAGYGALEYYGGTSAADKAIARAAFAPEAENDLKAFVGQPQSGGTGLNLSAAGTVIWFSHTFDAIVRGQANERATMIGGRNVDLLDLVGGPIDRYMLDNLGSKQFEAQMLSRQGLQKVIEGISLK